LVYGAKLLIERGISMIGRPFPKGMSGNAGGRPKAAHSIQELARQHAPEAIQTLADIAKNGTPGARVSAAIALLDRAYGKAPTFSTSDTQAFKRAADSETESASAIFSRSLFQPCLQQTLFSSVRATRHSVESL
jgi:hypothetical protein